MKVLRSMFLVMTTMVFGAGCGRGPSQQGTEPELGPPLRSALSAPPAASNSSLAGFVMGSTSLRVYFLGSNNQVSQLAWMPPWYDSDVTGLAGVLPAAAGSPLTAFPVGGSQPHVYYLSASPRHVHEAWWDGQSWHDNDVSGITTSPDPAADSPLAGFALNGSLSRVYYVSANTRHVWQLAWDGSSWSAQDVTSTSLAPSVGSASALTAFSVSDTVGSYARVYFVGADSHVYEMWSSGGILWASHDLNGLTNAPAVQVGTGMTGFAINNSLSQVYYVSTSYHVIGLQWSGQSWSATDLTLAAHSVNTSAYGTVTGFVLNGTYPRVYFVSATSNVYELWWDGANWYDGNLTTRVPAPAPRINSPLAGVAIDGGVQSRVYYLGNDNNVYELGWNGTSWGYVNVTAASN